MQAEIPLVLFSHDCFDTNWYAFSLYVDMHVYFHCIKHKNTIQGTHTHWTKSQNQCLIAVVEKMQLKSTLTVPDYYLSISVERQKDAVIIKEKQWPVDSLCFGKCFLQISEFCIWTLSNKILRSRTLRAARVCLRVFSVSSQLSFY